MIPFVGIHLCATRHITFLWWHWLNMFRQPKCIWFITRRYLINFVILWASHWKFSHHETQRKSREVNKNIFLSKLSVRASVSSSSFTFKQAEETACATHFGIQLKPHTWMLRARESYAFLGSLHNLNRYAVEIQQQMFFSWNFILLKLSWGCLMGSHNKILKRKAFDRNEPSFWRLAQLQ